MTRRSGIEEREHGDTKREAMQIEDNPLIQIDERSCSIVDDLRGAGFQRICGPVVSAVFAGDAERCGESMRRVFASDLSDASFIRRRTLGR